MVRQLLVGLTVIALAASLVPGALAARPFEGVRLVILSASDGAPGYKIISPYIPQFEQETGAKVEFTEMSQDALHAKMATVLAARSADVDLFWTWSGFTAEFAYGGLFKDMSDKLSQAELDDLVPGAMEAVSYKTRVYGLPKFFSIRSFYYNKRMFAAAGLDPTRAPRTWDEFVEAAKKTTNAREGRWGVLHDYGSNNSLLINFQEHLVLTGGRLFDNNDNILFNNELGVEALQRVVDLNKLGVVDPASFGIGEGPVKRARWIKGNNAMEWGWAADYNMSLDPSISSIVDQVAVGLIPGIRVRSAALTGSEGYALSTFSKNEKAAVEFLKFITRASVQKDMTRRTGWYPVRKSVFADPDLTKGNPLMLAAKLQSQYPTYRFAAPYTSEVNDLLGPQLLAAIKGEKSAKQALDDAAAQIRPVVAKYKAR
jgi:multiple sugar transport system substrate-binding protein